MGRWLGRMTTLAAALAVALPALATAQESGAFPQRAVHVIVPTAAGGPSDTAARLVAQGLTSFWGRQVVVENRPGASGAVAAQAVMAAPPDGHMLLWTASGMAGLPFLQRNPPYRDLGELTPVSNAVLFVYGLYASGQLPITSLAELVSYGKAAPGRLSYGAGTVGEQLAAEFLMRAVGVQAMHVPYRGAAHMIPDLIKGDVAVNAGPLITMLPHIAAGKVRLLAVMLPQRSAVVPDIPTLAELGVTETPPPTWNALFGPPRMAPARAERIADAVVTVIREAGFSAALRKQGVEPIGSMPQALAADTATATAAWRRFVQDYGIPPE